MNDLNNDTQLTMDYLDDYQEAAAEPSRLRPGKFYFEVPSVIPSVLRTDGAGRTGLDFNLGQLRIVATEDGEAVRGYVNKFFRISTLPRGAQGFSDAVDFVKLFGLDPKEIGTSQASWDAAMASLAGARSPIPVRFDYSGYYKHPVSGRYTYLKGKDFLLPDGEYARAAFVIDGQLTLSPTFPDTIGKNDIKAQTAYAKAQNWIVVYANFEPGYRAFAAKA